MNAHTVIFTPSGIRAKAQEGQTVYDVALDAGVDIQSICGGKGLCKRCQCEIDTGKHAKFKLDVTSESIGKLTPTEKKAIHDGELSEARRLACRAKIKGDLVVEIPSDAREAESSIQKKSTPIDVSLNPAVKLFMVQLPVPTLEDNPCDGNALIAGLKSEHGINSVYSHEALIRIQEILRKHERTIICVVRDETEIIDVWPPSGGDAYGAAIDVGSTSVALYVFNLSNGKIAYEKAAMNPQIRYGEDLMSRVSYIMMNKGGEIKLTDAIRGQIKTMLSEAVETLDINNRQLLDVICVGNPIMHHLLIGANPVELGQAPFALTVKDWLDVPARKLDLGLSDAAQVSLFPLIGGHVGADTTAAYLTQMDNIPRSRKSKLSVMTTGSRMRTIYQITKFQVSADLAYSKSWLSWRMQAFLIRAVYLCRAILPAGCFRTMKARAKNIFWLIVRKTRFSLNKQIFGLFSWPRLRFLRELNFCPKHWAASSLTRYYWQGLSGHIWIRNMFPRLALFRVHRPV